MSGVRCLGYIRVEASDLGGWETFATQVLGLQSCGITDQRTLDLRMDDRTYRIALEEGAADDIACLGLEVADSYSLDRLQDTLERNGVSAARATKQASDARHTLASLRFNDPDGLACEAYFGPSIVSETPFRSPRPISGFVTGENGLGHVVLTVSDIDASLKFYCDGLGFKLSDVIELSMKDGPRTAYFLHCNSRHHTIALAQVQTKRRLLHFMLEVGSVDDVGWALDAVREHDIPIMATLGRHVNDHMLSFYMKSPSGFEIEYGWGANLVDETNWVIGRHKTGSIWGHHRAG